MTVTEVKNSKGERYYVLLSDGSVIKTTLNVVLDFHLKCGEELSGERYEKFVSASSLARAKLRALRIIGATSLSVKELRSRLVQKGESEENARASADWCVDMGYLDDEKFGGMIVRHYAAKGYGVSRIKSELYKRGVPRELWEGSLEQLPQQDETIDKLLRSRLKGDFDQKDIKRASDALQRRGFSWEDIKSALTRYMSELED